MQVDVTQWYVVGVMGYLVLLDILLMIVSYWAGHWIGSTVQKMKFSFKDFFSKCDQIRSFLRRSHLGGRVRNFLLERGDKPEKCVCVCGGGGGCHFLLLYSSITFTVCGGKVRFPLLLFGTSVFSKLCKILFQVFIVLKPDIICTFLIHSVSLQKMLTALLNLVCNTQKIKWTIFWVQRQDVS